MAIFRLSLLERFTDLSQYPRRFDYISVEGIGLMVGFDTEEQLSPENLRRHMFVVRDTFCFVEADDVENAVKKFHLDWQGAVTGARKKALWINRAKPILKIPDCSRRSFDGKRYLCGDSVDDEIKAECMLSGLDPEEDCPVLKFIGDISRKERIIKTLKMVVPHGEFLVISQLPVGAWV